MRFYLFGTSALWRWHRRADCKSPREADTAPIDCVASTKAFEFAAAHLADRPQPIHFCVDCANNIRRFDGFAPHVVDRRIRNARYIFDGNGIYLAAPELAFLQAAGQPDVTDSQLIMHANALVAAYFLNPDAETGMAARKPLTTRKSLLAFLDAQPTQPGLARAHKAALRAFDGAASPKESEFVIKACLPGAMGGRGCPEPLLNHKITPRVRSRSLADRTFYKVDFCFPKSHLAVEYDSNLAHLSPAQKRHDEKRRQTLEHDGYKVISVVAAQLASREQFNAIMSEILRCIGARVRTRSKKFDLAQAELFRDFENFHL